MDRLIDGFRRFRDTYFEENKLLFKALAHGGQQPKVLLIGCSDSRVDPGLIFGAQPGEMFVLRNVANLVPPFETNGAFHGTSAAIEFAVRKLEVEHIVVLGHAGCGGVQVLLDDSAADGTDFLRPWMDIARSARDRSLALTLTAGKTLDAATRLCEQETVAISLSNLMTFPWLHERVEQKRLMLYGWWFNLESGELFRLDPASNTFVEV